MKFIESATDMECAMNITDHILHPCFFLKDSKEYQGLRQTYVSMAENLVIPELILNFLVFFCSERDFNHSVKRTDAKLTMLAAINIPAPDRNHSLFCSNHCISLFPYFVAFY